MKKPLLLSRLLQLAIVFSFFLPFFFVGCEGGLKSDESAAPSDSMAVDTTMPPAPEAKVDTASSKDTVYLAKSKENVVDSVIVKTQNDQENNDESDKSTSINIAKKHSWLKPFLYSEPNDPNLTGADYTGIGLIVNIGEFFPYITISFAFLLIISCLFSKLIDSPAVRTHLVHNGMAILFLSHYVPSIINDNKALWGYWICMILLFSTMLVDIRRMRMNTSKRLY